MPRRRKALIRSYPVEILDRVRLAGDPPAGAATIEASLFGIASAISVSPLWESIPGAGIVVRAEPVPTLGILGELTEADEARLRALFLQVEQALIRLRYVSYSQAEQDCAILAERLQEALGRDRIARCRFAAIPRGGHIVLGMLSSVLGLRAAQLDPADSGDERPLVVVDDCAITGNRLSRFLLRERPGPVVFAHLYSHPQLRASIEEGEPAVSACVAAQDLRDWGPDLYGGDYDEWLAVWRQRDAGLRYWAGVPDYLCLAWKEPDWFFWNEVTQQVEGGWSVVPPDLCLGNRPVVGRQPLAVQRHSWAPGPLQPADQVLYAESDGRLVVGDASSGDAFALDGVASDMWRALAASAGVDAAAAALAARYDVSLEELRRDLESFVDDLIRRGVLEKPGTPLHGS